MYTVKLLKRAELELIEACNWYEKQKKGLSASLRKEVRHALKVISETPLIYASRHDTNLRFTPLNKFPYVIIYWYDEQMATIFVVSVFHTKRKPIK